MYNTPYNSRLLENAVGEFAKLPGIGRKTALRLVLHLLKQEITEVEFFGQSIINLRKEIKYCKLCHNLSDTDICHVCSDKFRFFYNTHNAPEAIPLNNAVPDRVISA